METIVIGTEQLLQRSSGLSTNLYCKPSKPYRNFIAFGRFSARIYDFVFPIFVAVFTKADMMIHFNVVKV
jgi:hypothetical protein